MISWTPPWTRRFETGEVGTIEFVYPGSGGGSPAAFEERIIPEIAPDGSVKSLLVIAHDVTERRRLEKATAESRDEIRALAGRLLTAQEEERTRVSRELHDSICQQMASIAIEVGGLVAGSLPGDVKRRLRTLQGRVVQASDETRRIAHELHPSILDDLGVAPSVGSLCKEASKRLKVPVKFTHNIVAGSIPRTIGTCLYRVAQESLGNVAKHARAKHVSVELKAQEGRVTLLVSDDGVGFEPGSVRGRGTLGLVGMAERAQAVDGKLSIESKPQRGTRITLEIPLPTEGDTA